ncbi:MAG: hypothetical protein OJF47_002617 [Nitrospira sp.]|jgi:HTH-type transcriptional regulator/antitoxin HigA|nr:MAG: hypothetical protein OJF47_002617 [Nitrospira sp.]
MVGVSTMTERTFAEIFPPGEFIEEELEARGWTQIELAEILGRTPAFVNELVKAKRGVTPETAKALGNAFGSSAQYWMNLETAYQLWKLKSDDRAIARRARLYQLAPIKEMVKRHWIEPTQNIDVLEQEVLQFFGIASLDEMESMPHAARKSTSYHDVTPSQRAWLRRASALGMAVTAKPITKHSLAEGFGRLRQLLHSVEEIRQVPRVLSDMGIRFVVVEALPQTRIDGACIWLDRHTPVIALSLRYDRIDAFWFSLAHELGHVKNGDGAQPFFLDTDLVSDQTGEMAPGHPSESVELRANAFASEFLVPKTEMDDFIARTAPLFYGPKILRFAKRIKVHPGIIVGQLQHRKQISYSQNRKMLERIKHIITQSALTDGWGSFPPANL